MKTDKSSLPCSDKKQMVANQKVPFICYTGAFKKPNNEKETRTSC